VSDSREYWVALLFDAMFEGDGDEVEAILDAIGETGHDPEDIIADARDELAGWSG